MNGELEEKTDERFDSFGIAMRSLVAIREEEARTVTIYYTASGSFTAKTMKVPRKEFMRACTEYADMVAARASAATVDDEDEENDDENAGTE